MKGGATNFLLPLDSSSSPSSSSFIERSQQKHGVVCSVTPRTGRALLFRHDLLHEGAPLLEGTKYILRTELLYRRVKSALKVPHFFPASASFPSSSSSSSFDTQERLLSLYNRSEEEYAKGNAKEFVESYLAALDLQKRGGRKPRENKAEIQEREKENEQEQGRGNEEEEEKEEGQEVPVLFLPGNALLKVLGMLTFSEKDLAKMMLLNRTLYRLARSGELWRECYLHRFAEREKERTEREKEGTGRGNKEEEKEELPWHKNPLTVDWYKLFKQKHVQQKAIEAESMSIELKKETNNKKKERNNKKKEREWMLNDSEDEENKEMQKRRRGHIGLSRAKTLGDVGAENSPAVVMDSGTLHLKGKISFMLSLS